MSDVGKLAAAVAPLTGELVAGEVLRVPVKHGEGQLVASAADLERIERDGLVVLRYCSPDGVTDESHNPNGASNGVAGLRNEAGNVVGLMPHPERVCQDILGGGGEEGRMMFECALACKAGTPERVGGWQ